MTSKHVAPCTASSLHLGQIRSDRPQPIPLPSNGPSSPKQSAKEHSSRSKRTRSNPAVSLTPRAFPYARPHQVRGRRCVWGRRRRRGTTSHQARRTITPPVPEPFMHWAWPEGKQSRTMSWPKSQLCRDRSLASTWVRKGAIVRRPAAMHATAMIPKPHFPSLDCPRSDRGSDGDLGQL